MSNSCLNCPLVKLCTFNQITFLLEQLKSWVMFPVPAFSKTVRDVTSFFNSRSALVMPAAILEVRKINGGLKYMATLSSQISILCASDSLYWCFQYHSILQLSKHWNSSIILHIYSSLTLGMEDHCS